MRWTHLLLIMAEHNFTPDDLQLSKFRFYSVGIVADNKALSSNVIEVVPIEEHTMVDGEINGQSTEATSDGVDASGQSYSLAVKTSNTIQATWLKLGESNRMTSPNVRRGAKVMIYQFGNADKYYWTTLQDDSNLRKLETVVWGISGTSDESATASHDTMYYFEVSSHTKTVTFHTSQANGEPYGYDIQINAADGNVRIQDTSNNVFILDSAARQLLLQNSDGSKVEVIKSIINLKADTINAEADTLNLKGGTTNISGDLLNVTTSDITMT